MASQTQQTQTQTQESNEYSMYDQSFDAASTAARFISTTNLDRFETVVIPRRQTGYVYKFGRHASCDYKLTGSRFSNIHFKVWEVETEGSVYDSVRSIVMVEDTSTNGTFLNQARIGKGQSSVLAHGDELAAGLGVAADEVRYLVQLPQQNRPKLKPTMSAEAAACMQKYDIRQILGAGAFATVRCAVDRSTGVQYAVKILNQRKLAITNASAKATELFKREIEILQSTRHPNIVQYVDMWADAIDIFLVLEFLPGGDLMDYIMKRGKLGELETVKIVEQVLDALVYCHNIGIAHRDIKPENILLTADTPPVAKITDFGLAKMVEPGSFLKTFCGTLTYVAPEVISMHGRVAGAYSTSVDMWSVGCVTFIMLAGSMPFVAESQDTMMRVIQDGDYDDAALEEIELSGAGMDFIESLLRVNPEQRMSGQQAQRHPWIRNIDIDQNYEGGIWSSQVVNFPSQSSRAPSHQYIHESQQQGRSRALEESNMSAFGYDRSQVEHGSERPATSNTYGLVSEDSVMWDKMTNANNLRVAESDGRNPYSQPAPQHKLQISAWEGASHFSEDSSANIIGSSQYVSASSQVDVGDSNATITPQRLKQGQRGAPDAKNAWQELDNSSQKENCVVGNPFQRDFRPFQSEPVFRH